MSNKLENNPSWSRLFNLCAGIKESGWIKAFELSYEALNQYFNCCEGKYMETTNFSAFETHIEYEALKMDVDLARNLNSFVKILLFLKRHRLS